MIACQLDPPLLKEKDAQAMARFESPSGGTFAAIGRDSLCDIKYGVSLNSTNETDRNLTSSPKSSPDSVLSVLTKFLGASNTLTIFSSAPLTNWSRFVNATDASGYPWIWGRPSSAESQGQ